jgi:dihydrofolate reductase
MRKVIVSAFVSLDGVMQAPGGPDEDKTGGFKLGGWIFPHADQVTGGAVMELFSKPFELLLGRKTYDIFAGYWPYVDAEHPIGKPFNAVTKHVATRNLDLKLDWENSRSLGPDAAAEVKRLKAQDGPDLLVQGSSDFLQTLFHHDLVDELTTLTYPVVLGGGKRLFREGAAPRAFPLTSHVVSGAGVIIGKYARGGEVPTGSFPPATGKA